MKYVDDPATQLLAATASRSADGYDQDTVIGQLAKAVFDDFPPGLLLRARDRPGIILVLAANTAFNGFPVLGSILARTATCRASCTPAATGSPTATASSSWPASAIVLIVAFDAEVTRLIQLYIVGVFVSFTLSQLGMIRHWTRHLQHRDRPGRAAPDDALAASINTFGLGDDRRRAGDRAAHQVPRTAPGSRSWRWPSSSSLMQGIRRHYDRVAARARAGRGRGRDAAAPGARDRAGLQAPQADAARARLRPGDPARRCSRRSPSTSTPDDDRARCRREWDRRDIPVPLKVLDSPYREITRPIVDYVTRAPRAANPRDVVTVYIPEYVVGHWWEQLLHNQSALRLKGRLLFTPGVMVTSVPWQLQSSRARADRGGRRTGRVRPATCAAVQARSARSRRRRADDPRTSRARRAEPSRRTSPVGDRLEVEVGPVAHGGHCVARHDGRVVFVRHALPGERVAARGHRGRRGRPVPARPTPSRCSRPSPDRVAPPCPYAGPGRCGGCDLQHVDARRPSASSRPPCVARAAAPAGRLDVGGDRCDASTVEAVPGDADGLRLAHPGARSPSTPTGAPGCAGTARHDVVPRRRLPDRAPDVVAAASPAALAGRRRVEVVAPAPAIGWSSSTRRRRSATAAPVAPRWTAWRRTSRSPGYAAAPGSREAAAGRRWRVDRRRLLAGAPGRRRRARRRRAASCSRPQPGSTRSTCTAASGCSPAPWPTRRRAGGRGRRGRGRRAAPCADARRNLHDLPHGRGCTRGRVDRAGCAAGAPRPVPTSSCSTRRAPAPARGRAATWPRSARAPSPTSPATRPRWPATCATFAEHGYRLAALRAFDLFPMTHHVECVALLRRGATRSP